ncbi:hypothetical protein CHH27_23670 [Labrenzia sp. VG12]|nr:hypothetical protein CHH27_23670 [Labrenzia sp. VG12]
MPDEVSRSGKLFSSDVTGGRTGKEALSSINPLALALAAARDLCAEEVFLVGFDGYSDHTDASWLSDETQMVLKAAEKELQGISISSLLPTRYDLRIDPLYARLATKAD